MARVTDYSRGQTTREASSSALGWGGGVARGGAGKAEGTGKSILLAYFSFMCFDAHPDRDPLGAGHSPGCWGHSGGPHTLSSAC